MSISMVPNCHWLAQEHGLPIGLFSVYQLVQYLMSSVPTFRSTRVIDGISEEDPLNLRSHCQGLFAHWRKLVELEDQVKQVLVVVVPVTFGHMVGLIVVGYPVPVGVG